MNISIGNKIFTFGQAILDTGHWGIMPTPTRLASEPDAKIEKIKNIKLPQWAGHSTKNNKNMVDKFLSKSQGYFWRFKDITVNDDLNFQSIFYGEGTRGRGLGSRNCTSPLWIKKSDGTFEPIGFFAWKCSGVFRHNNEYGILFIGNQKIEAFRCDSNELVFIYSNREVGFFNYTSISRFLYLGSGNFKSKDTECAGFICNPLFLMVSQFHCIKGMSNNKFRGDIQLNGKKQKFLLFPGGNYPFSTVEHRDIKSPDVFARQPFVNASSIFDGLLLDSISFVDKLVLLFLFCRSRGFYMPGY